MSNNEQWLTDGKCSECRRKNYCKKRCKKSREALQGMVGDLLAKAMEKQLSQTIEDAIIGAENKDVVVTSEMAQAQHVMSQIYKKH